MTATEPHNSRLAIRNDIVQILDFMAFSEKLKCEMRHCWLSDGRQESVGEHAWQMALLAMLCAKYLEHPVTIDTTLKMILVHDLVEAEAGDVPYTHQYNAPELREAKAEREQAAISTIRTRLPQELGREIDELWQEFEAGQSNEARFARAMDALEAQIQHNLSDLATWEEIECDFVYTKINKHCDYDDFLKALCEEVKRRAEMKMQAGGIDIGAIKQRAG
jgi:putative hydrolase of HD superfamily